MQKKKKKGPVDRPLFTHADRQGAGEKKRREKNYTVFPLKSLLRYGEAMFSFSAASLSHFPSFSQCVCVCVCILVPSFSPM